MIGLQEMVYQKVRYKAHDHFHTRRAGCLPSLPKR
jgi:hypothetical protein